MAESCWPLVWMSGFDLAQIDQVHPAQQDLGSRNLKLHQAGSVSGGVTSGFEEMGHLILARWGVETSWVPCKAAPMILVEMAGESSGKESIGVCLAVARMPEGTAVLGYRCCLGNLGQVDMQVARTVGQDEEHCLDGVGG